MRIRLIGVGGFGANFVVFLNKLNGGDYPFLTGNPECLLINTDAAALDRDKEITGLLIGHAIVGGNGCGMNAELGRQAAEMDSAKIEKVVQGADVVFVCAAFGGGTGGGATPEIARLAHLAGAKVIVLGVTPFAFEEPLLPQAKKAIRNLSVNTAYVEFQNAKLQEAMGGENTLPDAIYKMNSWIAEIIDGIVCQLKAGHPMAIRRSCPVLGECRL